MIGCLPLLSGIILDRRHKGLTRRMTVNQTLFEWHKRSEDVKELEVELETRTTATVIGLMADALIAVVREVEHAEEATDEW